MKILSDIQYGNLSKAQTLDLYLPDNNSDKNLPLVFFIHGGGFAGGDKAQGTITNLVNFNSQNFVIASVNYRLSGEAPFPAGLQDCEKALNFLLENCEKLHLSSKRIAIMGTSAGGNFALMLGLNKNLMEKVEKKCVVAIYPVSDLFSLWHELENLKDDDPTKAYMVKVSEMYFNKKFSDINDAELKNASPLFQLDNHLPATLLQHGTADDTVPFSTSKAFYEKAKSLGIDIKFDVFEGANHSDPAFKTKTNISRIFEYINSKLK